MGASQSRTDESDHVFSKETPISFSQDLVNHLSDTLALPETSPERQSTLDQHIRSRIQTELTRLRAEEEHVREEIVRALEKENLDREREMVGEENGSEEDRSGKVKSSVALMEDLEEVRRKVDRYHARKEMAELPEVREKSEAVVSCYKSHPSTPLDCWREVAEFKASVAQVEQQFVDSLR